VPTWDILLKRCFNGPGWCMLCKMEGESITHLFLDCSYTRTTWLEAGTVGGFQCQWRGLNAHEALYSWITNRDSKKVCALPIIISWGIWLARKGIWLARNKQIFQDLRLEPVIVAAQSMGILIFYPQCDDKKTSRVIRDAEIDHSYLWAFFDGAAQGLPVRCGAGGVIYLSEGVYFTSKDGLGEGTSNYAELLALKLLLLYALENDVKRKQIYGDSMVVINWANGSHDCHIMRLIPIYEEVQRLILLFDHIIFSHVYRELNWTADKLSKEAAGLQQGIWQIDVLKETGSYGYYHRPDHEI